MVRKHLGNVDKVEKVDNLSRSEINPLKHKGKAALIVSSLIHNLNKTYPQLFGGFPDKKLWILWTIISPAGILLFYRHLPHP